MQKFGIVLAAGQGKRMKSGLYKVLHPVCGKPMVGHVTDTLAQLGMDRIVVVVGHGAEAVRSYLGDRVDYALQAEQLGTGHAVLQAASLLEKQAGTTVVICGDTPLVSAQSLREMMACHEREGAAATLMTAVLEDPRGYGRVIRDETGGIARIVEQKDCTPQEEAVREINAGVYAFDNRKLFSALRRVTNNNAQGEYYLTDVFAILLAGGEKLAGYPLADVRESIGVNDRVALAQAEACMRQRINEQHMRAGVTMVNPEQTYIETDVSIGADTVIYPGVIIGSGSKIGSRCTIGPNTEIRGSTIGNECNIKQSVIVDSVVEDQVNVGPFAYIRPGSRIHARVKIGDFVEIKNAEIGEGSKVPHLSYVGDATVGQGVNIGCGVITANYDGVRKHRTEVADGAFIGSNANLIAPVSIGKDAYVVAGSTITEDVPADAVAIARSRQINKEGYAQRLRERFKR